MAASSRWSVWSTTAEVVVTERSALAAARTIVQAHLAEVDRACSRFRADSEIRSLERAHGRPYRVSSLLAELIGTALAAAEQTEGSVDPTLGRELVSLGYDRDFQLIEDTERGPRAVLVRTPVWSKIQLSGSTVCIPEGVQLDLGATAKAFAADRSAALVAERLGCGVLVNLGGDIATAGTAPKGGWQITVQDRPGEPSEQIALPGGAALATSSTIKRTWQRGGGTLNHLLDPRTGQSVATVWRTVTVVAGSCLHANTLTTAAVVRGEDALGWLHRHRHPARLVDAEREVLTLCGWLSPTRTTTTIGTSSR